MLDCKSINTDFCVIGGGIAGICAAIAAARQGIKVVLMQERPVLGGNASSEIRMWICGARGKNNRETGILEEIMLENLYRNPTKNYYLWDTVLYDFVVREKNIILLLNCTCMDADTEVGEFQDGRSIRIKSVTGYQMTTQTLYTVNASLYSDCSGDSILAPLTGAWFKVGRESSDEYGEDTSVRKSDSYTMGMSCLLQGRETDRFVPYIPPPFSTKLTAEQVNQRKPDLSNTDENFWYLELGGDRDTIAQTEEISSELLPLATGMWDYIKNSGEYDAKKWELEFLGFLPGKRESRRMTGEYIVTQRDISDGIIFNDTVAYGGWPIDDHFPLGFYHKGCPNTDIKTPAPYTLPYRALYSANVENLFFAGRNISMTHMAMSSIRVMATCGLLGQAVGTAAAVAVKYSLTPHGVYRKKLRELQNILLDHDCYLPYIKRAVSEKCRSYGIYPELCNGEDRPHALYGTEKCGIEFPIGYPIRYEFKTPEWVTTVHIVFDSDLERVTLPGDWSERLHAMRANVRLDSPVMHMPLTLCRNFKLEIINENGERTVMPFSDNRRRFYHIPIQQWATCLTLTMMGNWGGTEKTPLFSFDFQ